MSTYCLKSIDADAFITPHLQNSPFDLAPSFWQQLEDSIKGGTIAVLDNMVKAEVLQGTDSLRDWMDTLEIGELIDRRQPDILVKYSQVLTQLQANPCYQEAALREWSKESVADPWIVATAPVYAYTLIMLENPIPGLSLMTPTKKPKIWM